LRAAASVNGELTPAQFYPELMTSLEDVAFVR
jgi:hypothetical protein